MQTTEMYNRSSDAVLGPRTFKPPVCLKDEPLAFNAKPIMRTGVDSGRTERRINLDPYGGEGTIVYWPQGPTTASEPSLPMVSSERLADHHDFSSFQLKERGEKINLDPYGGDGFRVEPLETSAASVKSDPDTSTVSIRGDPFSVLKARMNLETSLARPEHTPEQQAVRRVEQVKRHLEEPSTRRRFGQSTSRPISSSTASYFALRPHLHEDLTQQWRLLQEQTGRLKRELELNAEGSSVVSAGAH